MFSFIHSKYKRTLFYCSFTAVCCRCADAL